MSSAGKIKKATSKQIAKKKVVQKNVTPKKREKTTSIILWIVAVVAVTAIALFPMLKNSFTNWDDEYYIIKNGLLPGPDWAGIFSQPVVSNYHPLTVITLAINYKISQLDPGSYMVLNYLLHIFNTLLVFYFTWLISDKKVWVAFITALIFGIHPMHVESVAWASERKDVLYTFFFLLGLIQYWKYLQTSKSAKLWLCFFLFACSLLSKPAAIIFPLVMLALDYWKRRPFTSKVFIEKIPFFVAALIIAIVTVKFQSAKAIAGLDLYPLWTRPLFACYSLMIYFVRFFVPTPLSAFHPYPPVQNLGWAVYISPIFILAVAGLLWWQRKNRLLIFGAAFFVINLLLVMQLVSIGQTIVSERYTYVPYIGLAFVLAMLLYQNKNAASKALYWGLPLLITGYFGYLSFERTKVWKDSGVLWLDAISHYPTAPMARTNHANYTLNLSLDPANAAKKDSLYASAMEDCAIALKENPKHAQGYQNREFIYLNQGKNQQAIADANKFIELDPTTNLGYAIRGVAYSRLNEYDKALADLNKSLSLDANNEFALDNRGALYYNHFKKYPEALSDFTKAIDIKPAGSYYLNRSYCYFMLGDLQKAKADAQMAVQKGMTVNDNYKKQINL